MRFFILLLAGCHLAFDSLWPIKLLFSINKFIWQYDSMTLTSGNKLKLSSWVSLFLISVTIILQFLTSVFCHDVKAGEKMFLIHGNWKVWIVSCFDTCIHTTWQILHCFMNTAYICRGLCVYTKSWSTVSVQFALFFYLFNHHMHYLFIHC